MTDILYWIDRESHKDLDLQFSRRTPGASGYDLHAVNSVDRTAEPMFDENGTRVLKPGQRWVVPTGIYVAMPLGIEAQTRSRSGLVRDHGVGLLSGTIDSDYRGEIAVILMNFGHQEFMIRRGERIAQLVFAPVVPECLRMDNPFHVEVREVETRKHLGTTNRGTSGFGSTGR